MKIYLILDCDFLAHRAYHAMGHLSHLDIYTRVTYGFLRDLTTFQDIHGSNDLIFCFDHGKSLRGEIFSGYKIKRRNPNKEEDFESKKELRKQIKLLKREYLPNLGYKNIFYQDGYEADDIISWLCQNIPKEDEIIIIGSDKDFYQLLEKNRIILWNPRTKKTYTEKLLKKEWGVTPEQWADVKAIAGCTTDGVIGVKGVKEITAAKYIRKDLKEDSKLYQKISSSVDLWRANLRLVKLPLAGVDPLILRQDKINHKYWVELAKKLGMKTLSEKTLVYQTRNLY